MDLWEDFATTYSAADQAESLVWLKACEKIVVNDADELRRMVGELVQSPFVTFDTETTGLRIIDDEVVSMQFCGRPDKSYFIPVGMDTMRNMQMVEVVSICAPLWKRGLIAHNAAYDWQMMHKHVQWNIEADTILEAKQMPELWAKHQRDWGLKALSKGLLGLDTQDFKDLFPRTTKKAARRFDILPEVIAVPYACQDVLLTWRLHQYLLDIGLDRNDPIYKLEHSIIKPVARMEMSGVRLDIARIDEAYAVAQTQLDLDVEAMHKMAGWKFSVESPNDVGKVLYEICKLPVLKLTDGGKPCTDAATLEKLKGRHPFVDLLVRYRNMSKLQSSFLAKLPGFIQKDGCIHTSFNQYGAISGRFSSKNPNMQQIPKERGKDGDALRVAIRSSFLPLDGHEGFFDSDYSQVEYRLAASLAQDKGLMAAFLNGEDVHQKTAAMMFGVALEDVDKQMRGRGKTANFAAIYGQGDKALADTWGISLAEAKATMRKYWAAVPDLGSYCQFLKDVAHDKGYCETYFGRKRYLPDINSSVEWKRASAEREGVNSPIQGMAADIVKIAIARIDSRLESFQSKMVLTVHDQLVFSRHPDDNLDDLAEAVRESMEIEIPGFVPIITEAAYGPNWNDVEEFIYPSRRGGSGSKSEITGGDAAGTFVAESVTEVVDAGTSERGESVRPAATVKGAACEMEEDFIRLKFLSAAGKDVIQTARTLLSINPGCVPVIINIDGVEKKSDHAVNVDSKLLFNLRRLGVGFELGKGTRRAFRIMQSA